MSNSTIRGYLSITPYENGRGFNVMFEARRAAVDGHCAGTLARGGVEVVASIEPSGSGYVIDDDDFSKFNEFSDATEAALEFAERSLLADGCFKSVR